MASGKQASLQRGAALGETPLPFAPRSIFEYISKKDQERIKNIAASRFAPFSTSDDLSPGPSLPTPCTKLLSTVFSPSWPIHLSRQETWADTRGIHKRESDYAKSATLFRPISGLHTPAAQPEEGTDSVDVAEEKPTEEVKEEAPKVHAARLSMYGVMTREVCTWQPARLLCECFGVKDPVNADEVDEPPAV
ncbi:hypothetical protein DFJ58DRAFT_724960 [Suillus subalutaceus]|uniref:uncharacterized protein n=1 Tax=Suillus subalutaceus TaxID=48586 RepID=UPI001B87210F|nr:uncharacterized protein DFJ58DRAFT_724960 [Suillus subalutaceus]KAG1863543.1 hypothetical protein DFJ58DRAFT_724960 [Suillus subalutaceus]